MLIFLDTEFSSVNVVPRLISIGLISEDGRRTFYAELIDTWRPADCSEFVLEMVLPLLEGGAVCMAAADLTVRLGHWLKEFGEPVQIATDSTRWDWPWIREIFKTPGFWPDNLVPEPLALQTERGGPFGEAIEAAFASGMRRHHALHDAKANRLGWLAASRQLDVAQGLFEVPDRIDRHNDEALRAFNPVRHGGEAMPFEPRGREVLAPHSGSVRYEFRYTVGEPMIFEFRDEAQATWVIHNEGDHLLEAVRLPNEGAAMRNKQARVAAWMRQNLPRERGPDEPDAKRTTPRKK